MNIYALLSLCASTISITLGIRVYFLNKKSVVNKLFMLTMIANAYWAFCEFMLSQANTVETAAFWGKALSFWPFLVAFSTSFYACFHRKRLIKKQINLRSTVFSSITFFFD
jgi:hypothetical protein